MNGKLRRQTQLIIRRGTEYLVGTIVYSKELRWSRSPYDAWGTRNREAAEAVAGKVGGTLCLWNPVVNQLREL